MSERVSYYVILDFEATCDEKRPPRPQEIIEFPSVIIDASTRQIISEFRQYVKPKHHPELSEFCTQLTGISQAKVNNGCSVFEAVQRYNKWLAENGLIGDNFIIITCGNWDLGTMYPAQCKTTGLMPESHFKRWVNIKDEYRDHYGRKSGGMMSMLEHMGIEHTGRHHSGIDDCRNIAQIWIQLLNEGYQLTENNIYYLGN